MAGCPLDLISKVLRSGGFVGGCVWHFRLERTSSSHGETRKKSRDSQVHHYQRERAPCPAGERAGALCDAIQERDNNSRERQEMFRRQHYGYHDRGYTE